MSDQGSPGSDTSGSSGDNRGSPGSAVGESGQGADKARAAAERTREQQALQARRAEFLRKAEQQQVQKREASRVQDGSGASGAGGDSELATTDGRREADTGDSRDEGRDAPASPAGNPIASRDRPQPAFADTTAISSIRDGVSLRNPFARQDTTQDIGTTGQGDYAASMTASSNIHDSPVSDEVRVAEDVEWARHAPADAVQQRINELNDHLSHASDDIAEITRDSLEIEMSERMKQDIAERARMDLDDKNEARIAEIRDELQFVTDPSLSGELEIRERVARERDNTLSLAENQVGLGNAISDFERAIEGVESEALEQQAYVWLEEANAWRVWLNATDTSLSAGQEKDIDALFEERDTILNDIARHKDQLARAALESAEAAAASTVEQIHALQPHIADALRSVFRADDVDAIRDLVGFAKELSDKASLLTYLFPEDGVTDYLGSIKPGMDPGVDAVARISKLAERLDNLSKGLAAVNIALTLGERSSRSNALEQGMKDLTDTVSVFSDITSFLPGPAASAIVPVYTAPALEAIGKHMATITEHASQGNRASVARNGTLRFPQAEYGEQEMHTFMSTVMRAESLSHMPGIDDRIAGFLMDKRTIFSAGTGAELPTKGTIFKSLDADRARSWLYQNRERVWAMLYGSMEVPSERRR